LQSGAVKISAFVTNNSADLFALIVHINIVHIVYNIVHVVLEKNFLFLAQLPEI